MRTLSETFAPGTAMLPEELRTLVVSPEREVEPGTTVHAVFTFRNQGGAPATGVRVRFNIPEGLVYLVGTGSLDGLCLDDELGNSPLLARNGGMIGDVAPGEERRIEISYSVAGAIENGTVMELQAAVASLELQPVGSNIVRFVASSRAQLVSAMTCVSIEAKRDATPGSEAEISVRVHNAGESSARDVVIVAPVPQHTTYVHSSARVNGREIERELGCPYDRVHAALAAPSLSPNASATLSYRVRIAAPLADGTRIVAEAKVASRETEAFALDPAVLAVRAAADFGDERTTFSIDPPAQIRPGDRVTLSFAAFNAGTASADGVTLSIDLPETLIAVRGGARIDGHPVRDKRSGKMIFDLGRVDSGERVDVLSEAMVVTPLADGTGVPVSATLTWEPSQTDSTRRFERTLIVRSEPAFQQRRNIIARVGGEVVRPAQDIEATIFLANDGSAAASACTLRLRPDPALEDLTLIERGTRLRTSESTADLGTIAPYAQRRVTVQARVRTPYADRSAIVIGAVLVSRELGETSLGEATWRVDSQPAFARESSRLEMSSDAPLRPNQLADVILSVSNVGTDVARNVRVRLLVPPEASLESVEGATRERSTLLFGEIAPCAIAQARIGVRLLQSAVSEFPLTLEAMLTADAVLPLPLDSLKIVTLAAPDFSVGSLSSAPFGTAELGETVEWTLHLRNGGDGPAKQVRIRVAQPASLIYVPNSTRVNGVAIRDAGAKGPFAGERGIVLNEFGAGVDATIRWRDVVHNQLAAGEEIVRVAQVIYDDDRHDEVASDVLRVHAQPVFANAVPGLQFGLEGHIARTAERRALDEERFVELPPAIPVGGDETPRENGRYPAFELRSGNGIGVIDSTLVEDISTAGTVIGFNSAWLARTLRFLEEARFGGLVTHLFALRALLPDAIGEQELPSAAALHQALREDLDRLFIKLRLPSYMIAARDIETASSRSAIERLLRDAADARGTPADPARSALVLRGSFDPTVIRNLGDELQDRELSTALSWAALARLLPDSTSQVHHYRSMLIERLDMLSDMGPTEFIDALQARRDNVLDGALDVLVASLRLGVA